MLPSNVTKTLTCTGLPNSSLLTGYIKYTLKWHKVSHSRHQGLWQHKLLVAKGWTGSSEKGLYCFDQYSAGGVFHLTWFPEKCGTKAHHPPALKGNGQTIWNHWFVCGPVQPKQGWWCLPVPNILDDSVPDESIWWIRWTSHWCFCSWGCLTYIWGPQGSLRTTGWRSAWARTSNRSKTCTSWVWLPNWPIWAHHWSTSSLTCQTVFFCV